MPVRIVDPRKKPPYESEVGPITVGTRNAPPPSLGGRRDMPVSRIIEISEATLAAMEKLAKLTGVSPDNLGQLFQDALRTYEWIIHEQSVDRAVVSLPEPLLRELDKRSEDIQALPRLFENAEEARKYFKKAA
jgi:hypothetical protein